MIKKANLGQVDQVKEIADKYTEELGFIVKASVIEAIKNEELIVKIQNGDVIGFCKYHRRKDNWTTIYEIAVLEEYRGEGYGKQLINYLLQRKHCINLKCPVDNKSNKFYKKIGKYVKTIEGKNRKLNLYIILPKGIKLKSSSQNPANKKIRRE